MAKFFGTTGNDSIVGSAGADIIDISQGGEDTVQAGGEADTILVGGALDPGDQIDGGGQYGDVVVLDGDYSHGLVFTDTTVTNVSQLRLIKGHDYDLTLADGTNLWDISGGNIDVSGLRASDHVRIDASAFTEPHALDLVTGAAAETIIGGGGEDGLDVAGRGAVNFSGGASGDTVTFERPITHHDHLDGGEGSHDVLELEAGGATIFVGKTLQHFEQIELLGGDYDLSLARGNVTAGEFLQLDANNLTADQTVAFDGSAVRGGLLDLGGGQGDDTLIGGTGDDYVDGSAGHNSIIGGKGADILMGGAFVGGFNRFVYNALSDSGPHKTYDRIEMLGPNDLIDLSAIDADRAQAGNQAFRQVTQFDHHAGELVLSYDASQGFTTLAVDVNGDARADMSIHIDGDQTAFTGLVL